MAAARKDDLNLADPEDRAIYRLRVSQEYTYMLAGHVIAEARSFGLHCHTKAEAVRAIADRRIGDVNAN